MELAYGKCVPNEEQPDEDEARRQGGARHQHALYGKRRRVRVLLHHTEAARRALGDVLAVVLN